MNRNLLTEPLDGSLLDIGTSATPLTVAVGSIIFAYRGTVWITQDGRHEDFIVGPGEHFAVRQRGDIVISAVRDDAKIWVASPNDAANNAHGDVFSLMRARAHRIRAETFRDSAQAAGQQVSRVIEALTVATRRLLESSRRVPGH